MVSRSMLPRRVASYSENGQSSPSVTLERGSYRMRAPLSRPGPLDFTGDGNKPRAVSTKHPSAISSRWIVLVLLLLLGCLASFGLAYYLFTTRWDLSGHPFRLSADAALQVIEPQYASHVHDPCEKYLSYLPHSGYHNQRIAFENALTLAFLLNRTLIAPPVRLGIEPIRYYKFDTLSNVLALSGKEGLKHCALVQADTLSPPECANYHKYTLLPWEWLVNLTSITAQQRLIQRWDLTPSWVQDHLHVAATDIFLLKDVTPYEHRFLDYPDDLAPPNKKYLQTILIHDLAQKPHRLLQLGTMFGTSRLRLVTPENHRVRAKIRQAMVFAPELLEDAASEIVTALPSVFLGAHIRLGDGWFRNRARDNVRLVWWKLVHHILGFNETETLAIEEQVYFNSSHDAIGTIQIPSELPLFEPIPWTLPSIPDSMTVSRLICRRRRHSAVHLSALNVPLYIATDSKDPQNDALLFLFVQTFPCIFFLHDFPHQLSRLNGLRNDYDGVLLKPFLLPFLDSMVASRGWRVAGTRGSTFSRFVEDVLWPTYHGEDVVQRG